MVQAAVLNLALILFDLTYLPMRPTWQRFLPVVTRVYDPVKGISPHPMTDAVRLLLDDTASLVALDPRAPGIAERVARLRQETAALVERNPFRRAGQERALDVIEQTVVSAVPAAARQGWGAAVDAYWTADPAVLPARIAEFHSKVDPLLRRNYYRELDDNGRPVDRFWLLDLPFLALFALEFGGRWSLSIRRREYPTWYRFALLNWYDALGLIPYFRVFRLFRVASIWFRLRRSEVTRIGQDALSRAVAWGSNIIAEEISDLVFVRILDEFRAEIEGGTYARIFERTTTARRATIEDVAVAEIRELISGPAFQERLRDLLRMHLLRAADASAALCSVPLPNAVLRPLVRGVGEVVVDAALETARATLETPEGDRALRAVISEVLDQVLNGPVRGEIDALSRGIALDVVADMRTAVSAKKWAGQTTAENLPVAPKPPPKTDPSE